MILLYKEKEIQKMSIIRITREGSLTYLNATQEDWVKVSLYFQHGVKKNDPPESWTTGESCNFKFDKTYRSFYGVAGRG